MVIVKFTTTRQLQAEGLKKCDVAGASFVLLLVLYGHANANTEGNQGQTVGSNNETRN